MAYSEARKKKNGDEELLRTLEDNFNTALDHPTWVSWRETAAKCHDYKENKQWTSTELKVLEDRGQPPTVNNQISVTINRMVGQFVRQRSRLVYKGRNPQDEPAANVLTDLFLFIKQNNDLEFEEKDVAEDGFTGGFGVFKAFCTYDNAFQPSIEVKCCDSFTIFPDPYSRRYDWNKDANFVCEAVWFDAKDARAMYPGKATEIAQIFHLDDARIGAVDALKNDNYIDSKRERIRIVEQWYKTKKRESVCIFSDGTIINKTDNILYSPMGEQSSISDKQIRDLKAANPNYREHDRLVHKLNMAVFTKGIIFEQKETDLKLFPYVPYFVQRKKSGEPYSLIYIALSMQDAINKRESKALHLLTANQSVYEEGAITDKADHALEKARADGQIEINRNYFDKFQLVNNLELAQGQLAMHAESKQDFRRITGINPDAMGERSEVRSGVGIARKQAMTDTIIAPVFDNFKRTRAILGRVVLELIQNYYTEPKIFYITDDLNATKEINLNENTLGAIKESIYDVIIDEGPDATTRQEEQLQILGQILPAVLPFGPVWGEILFEMSDIRDKQAILERVRQASQPPPTEPKINFSAQLDQLTAPERAFAYLKMGAPEIAQMVMQMNVPPSEMLAAQGENMKQQGEMAKMQMEMQASQMKTAMDLQSKQAMTEMDIQKKQAELAAQFAKLQIDIERARATKNGKEGNQTSV